MNPTPTGILRTTRSGIDLELTRVFRAPIDDVWASVTEADRTAKWFGKWEGEGRPGKTIRVQMGFEEGAPWSVMVIESCEAPRHLAVSMSDSAGDWHLEMTLDESDDVTTLVLVQHRVSADGIGDIGPGWEYYLDMLAASRDGDALPSFDDYYPAQKEYYEQLSPSPR
ncbi:SRPBCC family protein [Rhodococcus chondri]|uniref:SRPBCC family protein n=1 Tax=Rhodococcus chondri TaxID=3065941 RepID=A0ABU7JTP4_9NOCA|nr:SRPBCC family protein [Rhodococcus sp. CC-R104]MEE2033390.1 SRPBCC family protein [Rhodococcus sp. CC-R104]